MALPAPKESDIQRACLGYLRLRGWLAWRNNSGAVTASYKGKRRFFRFNSAPGSSDLFFVAPAGRFGCVEVKRPGNEPTEIQASWLETVRRAGGVALCVHSVDELIRGLKENGL